jgi:hypothetical protein
MKRWSLLLLLIIPAFTHAQQFPKKVIPLEQDKEYDTPWGFGVGYHSAGVGEIELSLIFNEHRFHLGATIGWSGPYEEEVPHLINDSRVRVDRTGYFVRTGDIGYSRFITERMNIKVDLSLGSKIHYTNYSEEGPEGRIHYSYIHSSRFVAGGGIYFGYCFNRIIELYAGYSSLREAGGGIRFNL